MLSQSLTRLVGEVVERAALAIPAAVVQTLRGALLPHILGTDCLDFRRRLGTRLRHVGQVFHLEHDVFFERVLNLGIEIEDRQLQQANGLLQLRRHGQ